MPATSKGAARAPGTRRRAQPPAICGYLVCDCVTYSDSGSPSLYEAYDSLSRQHNATDASRIARRTIPGVNTTIGVAAGDRDRWPFVNLWTILHFQAKLCEQIIR